MVKLVRYTGDGDCSALYVDGVLDRSGDHYLIDERIAELAGVVTHNSNYFMLGGNSYEGIARSIDEIDQYASAKAELEQEAADLKRRAAELIERAKELQAKASQKLD
jgi:hypothetical protein